MLLNHLRSLVYEKRIRDVWSYYLPLIQRILNYTVDGSIGTQPARLILGDLTTSDLAIDVPAKWSKCRRLSGQALRRSSNVGEGHKRLSIKESAQTSCRWSRKASRSDEVRGGPVCLAQVSQQAARQAIGSLSRPNGNCRYGSSGHCLSKRSNDYSEAATIQAPC